MSNNENINNINEQANKVKTEPISREERKDSGKKSKVQDAESEQSRTTKKLKKPRVRIIPIWLRIVLVLIFCFASLIGGLAIGYGVIGDGNASDVFHKETWQHIVDIVVKEK